MANVEITPYRPGQEAVLARIHNAASEEWDARLGPAYEFRHVTAQDVLGWGHDLTDTLWLAHVDGEPAGYAQCRVEKVQGVEPFLSIHYDVTTPDMGQSRIAVVPKHRRMGVATKILRATLEHYSGRDVDTANVYAYSDNDAASALLTSLGFTHEEQFYYSRYSDTVPYAHDSVFAELDLRQPLRDVPLNADVVLRSPREDDLDAMVRVFGECSPWVYGPHPSSDEVLAWIRDPWGEVTLVAEYKAAVVGAMEFSDTGRIGVPGILPEVRKKGIGTTLFYFLLKEMQDRGYDTAVADTGIMLQDAIRMYHRLGFHVSRRLWAWVRSL